MQPENHHPQTHSSPSDDAPFPPSSSPPHLPFHRHQPVPTLETGEGQPHLRHRATGPPSVDGTVRIEIRDPYADESRRRDGVSISTDKRIGELKDEIAAGSFDVPGVTWARGDMRLVWQGRIVRDEESIGDIIGKSRDAGEVHAFHLVARRIDQPLRPLLSRQASEIPIASSSTAPIPVIGPHPGLSSSPSDTRNVQALLDSTHYLLFTARHHLCHLTGIPVLAWDDVIPAPRVPQPIAREAVMSVLRVFHDAQAPENSWGAWEGAFEGDEKEKVSRIWEERGRLGVEEEIRLLWQSRIGRAWREEAGESVHVEIDGLARELHLPPLGKLSPDHSIHLLLYLRITSLLPHVIHRLNLESQPPTPQATPTIANAAASTPTPTLRPSPPANPLADIPLPVFNHLFFSALKISAMLWMLVGNMKWSDSRLWIIYGASVLYWAVDGYRMYQAALPRRAARPGAAAPQPGAAAAAGAAPHAPGAAGAAGGGPMPNATPAAGHQPVTDPAADPIRQMREYRARNPWTVFPLLHLDTDSLQLHVPAFSTHIEFQREIASQIANDPERADAIRRRAGRVPAWIQTQLLLPIALWFITLVPECEALRARAIRKRERAMRVLVGEMTIAMGEPVAEGSAQQEPVFPLGLGKAAEKYYRRVLHRGEGIDWQEEREAQMLLGLGEEEEDRAGDGMRMGML